MADIKFVSVPSKRLAASISASATSIQLNNIEGWDGVDLTSSDFGTVLYAVLRNDANTLMEIIELDPTTIASASITINRRGLKFTGDLTTEVTANKLTWVKNETIVELGSNPPQLLNHTVRTLDDQTIAGVKTFSSIPKTTGGNPTDDTELARKAYVDLIATGLGNPVNRIVVAATAGETITTGQLVYFDDTENEWMKCDADTAASVNNVILGIAQGAGTNGAAISGGVLLFGVDANQTGLTAGAPYYASNTAGGISASAGTTEVGVGFAKSTTELYFVPRYDQQITEDQQDALAGSSGTPSSSNKYITADDVSAAAGSGKIVRATGTALPALSAANLTSIPVANLLVASQAQGDIIYASSTTVWARLGAGTAGQFLKTNGAGQNPSWANPVWTELGSTTLGSANSVISVGSLTASRFLRVVIFVPASSGGLDAGNLTFNGDTGANYDYSVVTDGGAASAATGQAQIVIAATSNTADHIMVVLDITDIATFTKLVTGQRWSGGTGTQIVQQIGGRWSNTADRISTITLTKAGNQWGVGTRMTVFGII